MNFSLFLTLNDDLFISGNSSFGEKEPKSEDFKTVVRVLEENKMKIIGNNILEGFPKKLTFKDLGFQNKVKLISTGFSHILFHTKNLEVFGYGHNNCGQLGIGTISEKEYQPKKVKLLNN
jgi:alpha-tubulin suppressor-like RCC1 family protein